MTQRDSNLVEDVARALWSTVERAEECGVAWHQLAPESHAAIKNEARAAIRAVLLAQEGWIREMRAKKHPEYEGYPLMDTLHAFAKAHSIPLTTPEKGGE